MIWSLFTKPWQASGAEDLAAVVTGLGFGAAEICVRVGSAVQPERAGELPSYVERLGAAGVRVVSVASELTEPVFAACAEAGVGFVRVMAPAPEGQAAGVVALRRRLEATAALVERYGVRVGVQPHHGSYVGTTAGVMTALEGLGPGFGIVWDAGHDALAGGVPARTLALAAPRLLAVQLKSARVADGRVEWVEASAGTADWAAAGAALRALRWEGPVSLFAEYTATDAVTDSVRRDFAYARAAFGE